MELEWPLILFTFFLCLCGGTMAVQGLLTLLGKGKEMQKLSLIVSAVSLVVGGIAVFTHLQHWERIFNAFTTLLTGNEVALSGITLELWGCVVFALMLILYFLFMHRSEEGRPPKWCAVLAIVVGLALPVVTGDSYLMIAIPAWNTWLLILYYACNAVLLGSIVAMIISSVCKDADACSFVSRITVVFGVVSLIVVVAHAVMIGSFGSFTEIEYYFDPTHPDTAMVDSAAVNSSIMTGSLAGLFWGLVAIVGVAAPAALAFFVQRGAGEKSLPVAATAFACTAVGSIAWRCILYIVALSVFALY